MTELHSPAAKELHGEGDLRIAPGRRHGRSVRHRRLCHSPERTTPRDEGVLSLLRPRRWVLHDHRVEPERDRRRHEGHLHHRSRSHRRVGQPTSSSTARATTMPTATSCSISSTGTGAVTFSGGTGRFSGFHAATSPSPARAPGTPCALGRNVQLHPTRPRQISRCATRSHHHTGLGRVRPSQADSEPVVHQREQRRPARDPHRQRPRSDTHRCSPSTTDGGRRTVDVLKRCDQAPRDVTDTVDG